MTDDVVTNQTQPKEKKKLSVLAKVGIGCGGAFVLFFIISIIAFIFADKSELQRKAELREQQREEERLEKEKLKEAERLEKAEKQRQRLWGNATASVGGVEFVSVDFDHPNVIRIEAKLKRAGVDDYARFVKNANKYIATSLRRIQKSNLLDDNAIHFSFLYDFTLSDRYGNSENTTLEVFCFQYSSEELAKANWENISDNQLIDLIYDIEVSHKDGLECLRKYAIEAATQGVTVRLCAMIYMKINNIKVH